MSYKYTVLQDNPLAFFLLDEVRSGEVGVYSNLTTLYSTYQDLKDNGISYAAISGLPIIDYSGNAMEGYALNTSDMEVLPIIGAGVRGTEINEDTVIQLKALGVATSKRPDSSFSFEIWFSPSPHDNQEYLILGDAERHIGLFYVNENIVFKCSEEEYVNYKISKAQAMHVIGVFSKNKISLYVNGSLVAEKFIENGFKFVNDFVNLNIGPANTLMNFIVDSAAIYDYEITEAIANKHYRSGYKETKYSQIVYSNEGILFSLSGLTVRPDISYRYPGVKALEDLVSGDAYYNPAFNRIEFAKTDLPEEKSFYFEERLYVTNPEDIVSSRIKFGQDVKNILVEVSVPGQTWEICNNNSPLPYFNKNENLNSPILDIRVTMTTVDSSFDLPYFEGLEIDFYSNKDVYADNSGAKIYSDYDYSLGYYNYPVRMQNKYNGLSMLDGHGFSADLPISPKTIELFFTPRGSANVLFSSDSSQFAWSESGAITKNGIQAIYVNGINRTSDTNISTFFLRDISHHVIIVLSSAATSIKFNQNQSGSVYGSSSTYNNISFYEKDFTEAEAEHNYKLYCSDNSFLVEDPGMVISESSTGVDGTPNFVRLFD